MRTLMLRAHTDKDGVVRLEIPTDLTDCDLEIVLVIHPIGAESVDKMGYPLGYFEETYDSMADDPLERNQPPPPDVRDESPPQKRPSLAIEAADFLMGQPSLEELATARVSEKVQTYIHYLLDGNGEGELSRDEHSDLHQIMGILSVLDLMKAKAKLKLKEQE